MAVVRAYLPLAPVDLDHLAETGSIPVPAAGTRLAFAVTPELERSAPGLDREDLEYAAFSDAVAAASERRGPGERRVVAAVDVDAGWLSAFEPPEHHDPVSAVALTAAVPRARVASFHVDEHDTVVTGSQPDQLLWYDVTELDEVRGSSG